MIEVWGETGFEFYLLHVWRQRVDFPSLLGAVRALSDEWRPSALLIEDSASGQSLIQALYADSRLPVIPGPAPRQQQGGSRQSRQPLCRGRQGLSAAWGWLVARVPR